MRKILFITAFALCLMGSTTLFSQNEKQEMKLKKEIDSINKLEADLKKQEKTFKKELKELESHDVSNFIQEKFAEDFSHIKDVRWDKLERCNEATFINNGVVTKAYYNDVPELMGTIVNKTFNDLPEKAKKKINEEYADYEKVSVIYYDDSDFNDANILLYNEEISGPDTYFTELRKDDTTVVLGFNEEGDQVFHKNLNK